MNVTTCVVNDPAALDFRGHRGALADPAVLERERERVFDRCWIYVGHESEVTAPGNFRTRSVCGRPVIFYRDSERRTRVLLNSCRRRAMVCRESAGNARGCFCSYHGWSYDRAGNLDGVPSQASYPPSFDRCTLGLAEPPHVAGYRGFVFLSFDQEAHRSRSTPPVPRRYIDLVVDQSPTGEMEVLRGVRSTTSARTESCWSRAASTITNLLTTHSTWLYYMKSSGVEIKRPAKGHLMPSHGVGKTLGHGHAVTDNENFRGRPMVKWIPVYGEGAKLALRHAHEGDLVHDRRLDEDHAVVARIDHLERVDAGELAVTDLGVVHA